MKVPSYLPRALCIIKYLFAIGITIWALYQPYMNTSILGENIDVYMDKECSDNVCKAISDNGWKIQGTALEILGISLNKRALFKKHT